MRFQKFRVHIIASVLSFLIVAFGFSVNSVHAADIIGGTYFTVQSNLGKVTIYVNDAIAEDFGLIDGSVRLLNSSTQLGYILNSDGSIKYRVSIYPYGETWQYRTYSGNQYYNFTFSTYYPEESNLFVKGLDIASQDWLLYTSFFIGGAIIILLWFKR